MPITEEEMRGMYATSMGARFEGVQVTNTTPTIRGRTIEYEFKVNDRVRCIEAWSEHNLKKDMIGIIKEISNDSIGVDWGKGFFGHKLSGAINTNTGLWVKRYKVELITLAGVRHIPDISKRRLTELNQAQKYGMITSVAKHRVINKERENKYLKYFKTVKNKALKRTIIKKPINFKLGDYVNGVTQSNETFNKGMVIGKSKSMIKVLIYTSCNKSVNGYTILCPYKNLKRISRIKRLRFVKTKRLFEPKRIMTIKTNMKTLVKDIKKLGVKCRLVKGKGHSGQNVHYLHVITKDLIFVDNRKEPYKRKGQKYNFGKYEIKILIPPKKYKYKLDEGVINLGLYITARKVKGAIYLEERGYFHNPYISYAHDNHKIFRYICFGAGHSYILKSYLSKDYFALVELVISNLVSISDAGFEKLNHFLKALEKKK